MANPVIYVPRVREPRAGTGVDVVICIEAVFQLPERVGDIVSIARISLIVIDEPARTDVFYP
jgi:hypothetical protein